ncbi:MAG TPA: hypothetical protein PL096_10550 [Micropepsaceae bacterium]|nr:hypothetical protein [Micropepsaceae bacterium]
MLAVVTMFAAGAAPASRAAEGWTEDNGSFLYGETGIACHPTINTMTLQSAPVSEAGGKVWSCRYEGGGVTGTIRIRLGADYAATNSGSFALPFDPTDLIAGRWDMLIDQNPEASPESIFANEERVTTIALMKDNLLVECILSSRNMEYKIETELGFIATCSSISEHHRPIRIIGPMVSAKSSIADQPPGDGQGNLKGVVSYEQLGVRHIQSGSLCPYFMRGFHLMGVVNLEHSSGTGGDLNCAYTAFDQTSALNFFITRMPEGTSTEGLLERIRKYLGETYKAEVRTDLCESPPLADGTPVIFAGTLAEGFAGQKYFANMQTVSSGWSVEALISTPAIALEKSCQDAHALITWVAQGITHSGAY